jgi:CheY-like chemotaxis protein
MTTVLVVDDEASIRDLVAVMLSDEGYEVVSAGNGQEALHLLAETQPDLVLTDWMMPVMGGEKLLQRLPGEGLAVIVMSAALDPGFQSAHVAAFLPKPFDLGHLLATVRDVLGSRDA